jgi:hypothetical protein
MQESPNSDVSMNEPKPHTLDWDAPLPLHIDFNSTEHQTYREALKKSMLSEGMFFCNAIEHMSIALMEQFDDSVYAEWKHSITNDDDSINHEQARNNPLVRLPNVQSPAAINSWIYRISIYPDIAPEDQEFRQKYFGVFKACCAIALLAYKSPVEVSSTAVKLYVRHVMSERYELQ